MNFEFKCSCCDEVHKGIPTFGAKYPMAALYVPEDERDGLVDLGDDVCVINGEYFYLRGCIEIPVHGFSDPFIWGAWVEVHECDFKEYVTLSEKSDRAKIGPYYTRLSAHFRPYEQNCKDLNLRLHPRGVGIRPFLELEPTDHQMALEQRNGISTDRLSEIYEMMVHGKNV